MIKIAILFSGRGSNFAHLAKTLNKNEFEIVVALSNNPNAEGIAVAKFYDINLEIIDSKAYSKREDFDEAVVKVLQYYEVNLTVLAGFMRILTPVFTKEIKAINLHPSLLPRHKGLNAIEKSYKDEYEEGGVSIHYVSSELDSGDVIVQKIISKKGLSFETYSQKIRYLEKDALIEAIEKIRK